MIRIIAAHPAWSAHSMRRMVDVYNYLDLCSYMAYHFNGEKRR